MIRIRQLKIDALENQEISLKKKIALKLKIDENDIIKYQIKRQSLDARNKSQIFYVYEVDVSLNNEKDIIKKYSNNQDIFLSNEEEYQLPHIKNKNIKPIIVGSGPAGLFAAFLFIEMGIKPTIIERGEDIDSRVKTVSEFWNTNKLNPNSNVQFGEGGAGTFSDGKLNTLTKDPNMRGGYVLKTLVRFGAPEEILYSYKPHIGTDILRNVIKNMREYIKKKGGIFLYNTCLTDLDIKDNKLRKIEVNNNDWINCDTLILAIGHSSRDTFKMLHKRKIVMTSKPFAVGFRIQHSQDMINESQYGKKYKDHLGAANYKLTYQSSNGHGVYSFCMCPGGYVVNASSENGRLAINGMSNYKRNSNNANSAIVVTVNSHIYGDSLFSGMHFQEQLEQKAYELGKGNIPIQLLGDYLLNKDSKEFKSVKPEIKGNYHFANLNKLLPDELNYALKESFSSFEKKINGFASNDAILAGIESRTSSPIKIPRNENLCSNITGIFPCGEGAGYAGGIMTSAIDGMKIAEAIIKLK